MEKYSRPFNRPRGAYFCNNLFDTEEPNPLPRSYIFNASSLTSGRVLVSGFLRRIPGFVLIWFLPAICALLTGILRHAFLLNVQVLKLQGFIKEPLPSTLVSTTFTTL